MQPFKKLLASIGVGAATIDTQLETLEVRSGDVLKGQLVVSGGAVAQKIDDIYITVKAKYRKQGLDSAYFSNGTVCHCRVSESFTIGAGETKIVPFAVSIPLYTPITDGLSLLWLQTDLEIHLSKDAEDEDYLIVKPLPIMQSVLQTIEEIGFETLEVVCEDGTLEGMLPFDTGFYQVFRFVPTKEQFKNKIDELDVVFNLITQTETEVTIEINQHTTKLLDTLKEELGLETQKIKLTIAEPQIHTLKQLLTDQLNAIY